MRKSLHKSIPQNSAISDAVFQPLSTGKEKDSETGYYYFGARYYNPDLSLWLSVDPMADKYPNLSPYNYCAWNPVKLVDPKGKEIGDYYDENGKYLGWDGKNDMNVYIVTEKESKQRIIDNTKNGNKGTSLSDVNVTVSTNYAVVRQSANILNLAEADNGDHEFCTTMNELLSAPIVKGSHNEAILPQIPSYGDGTTTSIHSHPFEDANYGHWIEYMSSGKGHDAQSFQSYDLNIIVGQRDNNLGYGAAFYGRQPTGDYSRHSPMLVMGKPALESIANGYTTAIHKRLFNK